MFVSHTLPTNFSPEGKCEFLKEWNATSLWWDLYKQHANESEKKQQSVEEPEVTREDSNTQPMIDEDGELKISGNFEDISIPFMSRNAKSLPFSPVKRHEAIPLSEYGGRAQKQEIAPEVVQSWRRETFVDTDISQKALTSGFSSFRTETRPLARSTPPKSQQQQVQLSTIQQEGSRVEETVEPNESQPELEFLRKHVEVLYMTRSYPIRWAQIRIDS